MLTKNKNGFSLVQVMIAMGLMGGLSIMLMRQQQQANNMQTKMSYSQELNSVTHQIQTLMAYENNCSASVAGKKSGLLPDTAGDPINELWEGSFDFGTGLYIQNKTVFEVGKMVAGTPLRVESMLLWQLKDGTDAIRVNFEAGKLDSSNNFVRKSLIGGNTIAKYFRIAGEKTAGAYDNCYSEANMLLKTLMNKLPLCVLSESACTLWYKKIADVKIDVVTQVRRSCLGVYYKNLCGVGAIPGPRKCFCTAPNCSCTTPGYTCFQRAMAPCEPDNLISMITYSKCCRDP